MKRIRSRRQCLDSPRGAGPRNGQCLHRPHRCQPLLLRRSSGCEVPNPPAATDYDAQMAELDAQEREELIELAEATSSLLLLRRRMSRVRRGHLRRKPSRPRPTLRQPLSRHLIFESRRPGRSRRQDAVQRPLQMRTATGRSHGKPRLLLLPLEG